MDTYLDTLAPWEERRAYYSNIKPGNIVIEVKEALKKQTKKMISAQIAPAGSIISSQGRKDDVIHDIEYDMKSIGQGMRGLKAAFEWGISDVVWLIEKDREDLKGIIMALCGVSDKQINILRDKAEGAYASGKMDDALVYFAELEPHIVKDFSVCISLGIIYLFHKIDKKKALEYFEKAVKNARSSQAAYYASYTLLYKALIKRDFGLIEEAEECTNEAIKLSPGFTEAMYQNAQYNALLNRPEKAVPLLKKAIKEDIIYCLKISGERDFDGIKPEIIKLYEEIRNEKHGEVKEKLEGEKKSVVLLNNAVKGIQKLGYDVPKDSSVELFQKNEEGENSEIDKMMENNSIFDVYIADILLTLLSKKLKRKKERLKRKSNEIEINIDKQIQELSAGMAKKKSGFVSFLIFFLSGQIVALPFGKYIGLPIGIYITEGILFFICFYVSVILPQSKWKEINAKQNEKDKLLRVMKKI